MSEISLGDKVRDKISGLEGIAIMKTEFLNGCVQWAIQPRIGKNKDVMPEAVSVDSQSVEKVESAKVKIKPNHTGGPIRKVNRNSRGY